MSMAFCTVREHASLPHRQFSRSAPVRIGRLRSGAMLLAAIAAFAAAGLVPTRPAAAAESISVVLDQAQVVKLPDGVATIVIGNPLIADVSIQPGGVMVVTAKGFGVTNVVALDRTGKVLMDRRVQVQSPRDNLVVVYRGIDRESYSCAPKCERRITLGDTPAYFDATLTQAGNRISQAAGAPAAAK